MTLGPQAGAHFLLDPEAETRIGRGTECAIALPDPLCSRVHAVVQQREGMWRVADGPSLNGTFVNGQKIDEAVLADGHALRVGSTEFAFHLSEDPPTVGTSHGLHLTHTIIRDTRLGNADAGAMALAAIGDTQQADDLLLLYQLSIKLLGCADAREVMRISLDLLRDRAGASVAGFLWISDDGALKPTIVIPERASEQIVLSESLTRLVCQEGHAVWIAKQQSAGVGESLVHYADAICVPLIEATQTLGAIHIYLERGRFRQSHFDFAISLANIAAVALVRARKEASLTTDWLRLKAKSPGDDEMVGESPGMRELKQKIARLARANGCVLIRGESGAGKELVARALHRAGNRADRPMVSVNCAAIPADLMESQLFGHMSGSFTGADRDHAGYFQQADLGTLFLDEVGEMTLQGQSKLLRILEGHPFLPVGGTREVRVDVRVIAATNRDLLAYVREKKFREDLYYRLNVFELVVPPLAERGADIELMIEFYLDHFRRQHGRPELQLSAGARRKLLGYRWPGNVRQLRNVMDSAVVLATGAEIVESDLGLRDTTAPELDTLRLDHWERKLMIEALKRTGGNIPEAAKLLGIGRATLYRKLDEYGIER